MLPRLAIDRLRDPRNRRLVVALSGGVDSVVLLDLVTALGTGNVEALHVNHHLHEQADHAAAYCRQIAERYEVAITVADVEVSRTGSVEANARTARYQAFEALLGEGDLLLLAHHSDDQVETVIFRMLRGGGPVGLQGMPVERPVGRALLYRPLLASTREAIVDHARSAGLSWIEDPTNLDTSIDRNYIRHELLPAIEARFPSLRENLLQAEARDRRARERLQRMLLQELLPLRGPPDRLQLAGLRDMAAADLPMLMTAWLADLGLRVPGAGMLSELAAQISTGSRVKVESAEVAVREHAGCLYASHPLPGFDSRPVALDAVDEVPGIVRSEVRGKGLRTGCYEVRYRVGGETIRIRHARRLKNIFQEQAVPDWLRSRVPLLYHHDELVAVAGLAGWDIDMMVADGWQAGPEEDGIYVELRPGDRIWGKDPGTC